MKLGLGINLTPRNSISPSEVTPLVSADFKNDDYSIDGVPKTFAEILTAPSVAELTADVGLQIDNATGTTSASETVVFTAEAFAALDWETGVTGVIDVSIQDVSDNALFGADKTADPGLFASAGLSTSILASAAPPGVEAEADPTPSIGVYRIAFTLTPTSIACSANGGSAATAVPSNDFDLLDRAWLYLLAQAESTAIIEKIVLYSADDYGAADLPALSA
jgi:hypothetical protein